MRKSAAVAEQTTSAGLGPATIATGVKTPSQRIIVARSDAVGFFTKTENGLIA
jgi:hypothetical protein